MEPRLIAPFQTGLYSDIDPWLAPSDSFVEADNIHVHHGRAEKRAGYTLFGTIKQPQANQTITGITNANPAVVTLSAPPTFSNGDYVLITGVVGMTQVNNVTFIVANIAGNTFELQGIDSSAYGVYGGGGIVTPYVADTDRVMGIYRFITASGGKQTIAFNTKRANLYNSLLHDFVPLDGTTDIMSGGVNDYVWAVNWNSSDIVNRLYFTNGKAFNGTQDGIRYYDGTTLTTNTFTPTINNAGTILNGCLLLFTLKQRLIALHTYEGANTRAQRARWCQAQGPSNWNQDIPGQGGFVDAPTGDQIVSGRALQNSIIVFFTNSVWRLVPLSDPTLPFRWEKINNFRACDGKMASVGYDRYVVALGVRGITATDGVETRRIDERIQDFVVNEIETDQFAKVFCERSYANQRWWTLYAFEGSENNSALIFDDDSKAYTTYTIGLNCLGFGNDSIDWAYEDFTATNGKDWAYADFGEDSYGDYQNQDNAEIFLGGDITGNIYTLETGETDNGTEFNVDLQTAYWAPYKDEGREALLSYVDIYVDSDYESYMTVEFYKDNAFAPYASTQSDLLPPLKYVSSISNITQANPAVVTSPSHGLVTGDTIYMYLVEGMTEINNTAYTVTVIDENNFSLDGVDSTAFNAYSTAGRVYKQKFYKAKVWKRIYAGGIGIQHQLRIQMLDNPGTLIIHALKPYFKKRGKRTIN